MNRDKRGIMNRKNKERKDDQPRGHQCRAFFEKIGASLKKALFAVGRFFKRVGLAIGRGFKRFGLWVASVWKKMCGKIKAASNHSAKYLKGKNKSSFLRWCAIILLIVALLICMIVYIVDSNKTMFAVAERYIRDTSSVHSDKLNWEIRARNNALKSKAVATEEVLSQGNKWESDYSFGEDELDMIKRWNEDSTFNSFGLVDGRAETKLLLTTEMTTAAVTMPSCLETAYRDAMQGGQGVAFLNGLYGDEPAVVFYSGIRNIGVNSNNFCGMLYALKTQSEFSAILNTELFFFDGGVRLAVVDENNQVILTSEKSIRDIPIDQWVKAKRDRASEVPSGKGVSDNLVHKFKDEDGKTAYGLNVPLTVDGLVSWNLVVIFSDKEVASLRGETYNTSDILIGCWAAIFATIIVILGFEFWSRQRHLARKNAHNLMLMSVLPGLIIEQNSDSVMIRLSGSLTEAYGFQNNKTITQNAFVDCLHPQDTSVYYDALRNVLRDHKEVVGEVRIKATDGTYKRMVMTTHVISKEEEETQKTVTIFRNVDNIQRENEKQREILVSISSLFVRLIYIEHSTRSYTFLRGSEKFKKIPAKGNVEALLELLSYYLEAKDIAYLRRMIKEIFEYTEEREWYQEYEYRLKTGKWERITAVTHYNSHADQWITLFAVQAIDEQKEREIRNDLALREACASANMASKAKTTFLSRMSHDLRTPLNAIIGLAYLAQQRLDQPELVKADLDKVSAAGHNLLSMLNEVLDIAKIESDSKILVESSFDVRVMVKEIIQMAEVLAAQRQRKFVATVGEMKCPYAIADRVRLQQILTELINNAFKYTPKGGLVELSVNEVNINKKEKHVNYEFKVKDNGIGIRAENLEKIFEPFFRDENAKAKEGTGLGLTIARNVIQMMNGNITVESTEGKGSCFFLSACFKIGVERNSGANTGLTEMPEGVEGKPFNGYKVLLAEDNDLNLEIGKALLEELSISVITARDGEEAVAIFEQAALFEIDLILMDIQMPKCDGYEATRRIRASKRPDAKSIPIVAVTANAFASDVAEGSRAGMNDHLSKPIDIEKLKMLLKKYLKDV